MNLKDQSLITNLRAASKLLVDGQFDCVFSTFSSVEQFASELDSLSKSIENGTQNPIAWIKLFAARKRAKLWFVPTGDWDDIAEGEEAIKLGGLIYENL
ncbi:hypothetical protein [Neptunomonas sp.]|uniref:hypothetical protein n=1 Tax=Neptunomonas sp. TaxID=1971898 RepID=UPI0025D88733|nr:hypothetical protein [Neptunomonas sp.]